MQELGGPQVFTIIDIDHSSKKS